MILPLLYLCNLTPDNSLVLDPCISCLLPGNSSGFPAEHANLIFLVKKVGTRNSTQDLSSLFLLCFTSLTPGTFYIWSKRGSPETVVVDFTTSVAPLSNSSFNVSRAISAVYFLKSLPHR